MDNFECKKSECKTKEITIILHCEKCIKKIARSLSKEQQKEIFKIITKK